MGRRLGVCAATAFATNRSRGADGQPVKMQSGNTYRVRPTARTSNRSTHGQVNPFGMCFDPLGNLYTSDCHSKPST